MSNIPMILVMGQVRRIFSQLGGVVCCAFAASVVAFLIVLLFLSAPVTTAST